MTRARSCLCSTVRFLMVATDDAHRAKKLANADGQVVVLRTAGPAVALCGSGTLGGFVLERNAAK